MSAEAPTQDSQDNAFGAAASRDQDIDTPEEAGVTEDELPDESTSHAGAEGKVEPAGTSGGHETGEEKAAQNREEDPPA